MPSYRRRGNAAGGSSSVDGEQYEQTFKEEVSAYLSRNWWHPSLFATAMFSIATVVAVLRMLPYVAASNVVGALQISLWSMISKTSHFFLVLAVISFSIAVGLTYIYAYYHATEYQICISVQGHGDCSRGLLANLFWVVVYLYWSLFGLQDPNRLDLSNQAKVLETTGYLIYALFFVLVGLVLLNALIAVMTEVYNEIEINADIEWKFASTSMYLSFMQDGDVVPPPFNLLPSLGDFVRLFRFAKKSLQQRRKRVRNERQERIKYEGLKMRQRRRGNIKTPEKSQYQRVMSRLVERYVGSKTAEEMSVESDVNITDIRELRNDMLTLKFDIFQRLQDSVEDIQQAIGKGYKTRVKSIDANSIFKRAEFLHSTVNRHLKYVLDFKEELEATIAAIPDPPETTEKEVQTGLCGLTFDPLATHDAADISDVDTPKVVVSNGSQTSSQWMTAKRTQTVPSVHEIAMQTTKEHLVNGQCQTIPPPETSKIDVSTQISRYVYPIGSASVNGPRVHHKSKYKMLSCLIPGSAVQMDAYQTSSETTVQNTTSQKRSSPDICESSVQTTPRDCLVDMGQQTSHDDVLPGHDDKLTQTMVEVREKTSQTVLHQSQEVAVQAYATEFLVDYTSQTSLEVKGEESLQTKGDTTSHTSVVEINEETTQTSHEDLVDGSSQILPPALVEGSSQTLKAVHSDGDVQAMPDVNDIKIQTSREYLADCMSQTSLEVKEESLQTEGDAITDTTTQTFIVEINEESTQTSQEDIVDGSSQILPPALVEGSSQTLKAVHSDGDVQAMPDVNDIKIQTSREYRADCMSQTSLEVKEESLQTEGDSITDSTTQTFIVEINEETTQTSQEDLVDGSSQTLPPALVEGSSQTLNEIHSDEEVQAMPDVYDIKIQTSREYLADCMSQTSLEVKEEESLQRKGDAITDTTTQTFIVEIVEETTQTSQEDLNDGSSQTRTLPAMTEGSSQTLNEIHSDVEVQAMPDVNDIKIQTSREYLADCMSQTSLEVKEEESLQRKGDAITDTTTQTFLVEINEETTQTSQEDLVDGSSQTLSPALVEGSSQTLNEIHSDVEVQAMPDVNDIKIQTLSPVDVFVQAEEKEEEVENFLTMITSQFSSAKASLRIFEDKTEIN
ncbi:uncharacterized protein [Amphiura filiformis]|uniref:uncharacterized protein n=1 Tax=Amphiura filiformis TaxID=82378 RepID=UPI003B21FA5A